MKMPDIDGLEVLREIKKKNPNTVCFIATAYASYETAIESTRLGAYSYIPKPFTPEELLHHLEKGYNHRVLVVESAKLREEREERLLELASEKSRLNTIIKSIISGLLVINKSGEVVYYNDAVLKNLDLTAIEIGEKILEKLPSKVVKLVKKQLDATDVNTKSYSTEIEIKGNNELTVEVISSPVPHPDGSFAGVVIVIRNITETKKVELIKSQFVSMVAHELKTPIGAVLGFLNIILDENVHVPYEKQSDFLYRSVIRLQSLLDLVNDLLDISRMEQKTKQRELERLNLSEILDSTIQFLEFELRKKGIKITKEYKEKDIYIHADQNEITRLFTNILSNAVKYNKESGEISVKVTSSNHYADIAIKDTGIGLKTEEKERLFNEFFRAKNEHTRGISGTGLGLTIVKRIVDSYHGKISVNSEFGLGSEFIVQLPKLNIN
jgi:PAS domain S-box-containing protein